MKQAKRTLGLIVIVGSLSYFAYYWHGHPGLWWRLQDINPWIFVLLLVLYAITIAALSVAYEVMVRLCKKRIPFKENLLLTVYSAIVNFFGPLQSGPGFRMVYLKKKYDVSVKNYTFAIILYCAIFALISGVFLFVNGPLWLLALAVVGAILVVLIGGYIFRKKIVWRLMLILAAATFMQVAMTALIYFTELRTINHAITFRQAVSYTGAANFALFVSLTPGALGFRESFLLLSQRLHHVSPSNIISANIIDRAVYVAFLGVLFLIVLSIHAKDKLGVKAIQQVEK